MSGFEGISLREPDQNADRIKRLERALLTLAAWMSREIGSEGVERIIEYVEGRSDEL